MGGMRGEVLARMRHMQLMGKEAARAFPGKRNNRGGAAHLPPCAFSNLGNAVPLRHVRCMHGAG